MDATRHRVFQRIFQDNLWGNAESVSGEGSNLDRTTAIRLALPGLLARHGVRSMLDAPCGDFYWMKELSLNLDSYVGIDIVADLVAKNTERYANGQRRFAVGDLVEDNLPRAELVLCRDCLVHLSFAETARALENIRRSGATWLLTTTFTDRTSNRDIETGDWRPINLERAPYHFPAPLEIVNEGSDEFDETLGTFPDKALGLWRVADRRQASGGWITDGAAHRGQQRTSAVVNPRHRKLRREVQDRRRGEEHACQQGEADPLSNRRMPAPGGGRRGLVPPPD